MRVCESCAKVARHFSNYRKKMTISPPLMEAKIGKLRTLTWPPSITAPWGRNIDLGWRQWRRGREVLLFSEWQFSTGVCAQSARRHFRGDFNAALCHRGIIQSNGGRANHCYFPRAKNCWVAHIFLLVSLGPCLTTFFLKETWSPMTEYKKG